MPPGCRGRENLILIVCTVSFSSSISLRMYSGNGLRGFSTYGNMVRSPKNPTFSQDESLWKSRPPAFLSRVNDRAVAVVSLLISRCLFTSGVERTWRRPCRRTWWAWQRPRITRPSKCFLRASGLKSISWSPVRSWEDDEANFLGAVSMPGLDLGGAPRRSGVLSKVYSNLWKAHGYEYLSPPYCVRLEWGSEAMAKETSVCCQRAPATPTLEPDALIIATRNMNTHNTLNNQPIAAVTCSDAVSMSRCLHLKVSPEQCQQFANGTQEAHLCILSKEVESHCHPNRMLHPRHCLARALPSVTVLTSMVNTNV